jgi:hypothetical protein
LGLIKKDKKAFIQRFQDDDEALERLEDTKVPNHILGQPMPALFPLMLDTFMSDV